MKNIVGKTHGFAPGECGIPLRFMSVGTVLLVDGMGHKKSMMSYLFMTEEVQVGSEAKAALQPVKGKPFERMGRKATGLRPLGAGYGSRAAGHPQHLCRGYGSCTAVWRKATR
jgi:hypothetical protein